MSKTSKQLQQQHPESPWRWQPQWEGCEITSNAKKSMIGTIALATAWNAFTWAMAFFILPRELKNENFLALLILIFPLAGIGLAVLAFRAFSRYMKFGESRFKLAMNPGVIGGELVGVVINGRKLAPENGFKLTLNCIKRQVCGTGKQRRVQEKILWQSMQTVQKTLDSTNENETAIPVQFGIPFECEPCSADQINANRIYWKLEVVADQPGVDYCTDFEVPMFKTDESNSAFQPDTSLVNDFVYIPSVSEVYSEARLNRESNGDRLQIKFPFLRDAKSALGATLFLACWIGVTGLIGYGTNAIGSNGIGDIFGLMFVGVFALFGLLIALLVVDLWMWRGTILVDRNGMETSGGWFRMKPRFIESAQLKKFSSKRTMQSGTKVYSDLIAETTSGERVTIGRRIANEAAVRAIIDDIEVHLRRHTSNANSSVEVSAKDASRSIGFPSITMANVDSPSMQPES